MLVSRRGSATPSSSPGRRAPASPGRACRAAGAIQLTDEDVALLRTEVEEIDRISEEYAQRRRAHHGTARRRCRSTSRARTSSSASMRNMIPQEGGRFLNELDLDERRRVVFLGDQLKNDLFGEDVDAVGEQVRIDGVAVPGRRRHAGEGPGLLLQRPRQGQGARSRRRPSARCTARSTSRTSSSRSRDAQQRRRAPRRRSSPPPAQQVPLRPDRRGGDPDVGHDGGDEVPRHLLPRLPRLPRHRRRAHPGRRRHRRLATS